MAESYRGVNVEYVRGKPAVLAIYDESEELVEEVALFDIPTLDGLHAMMVEKGFTLMTEEEAEVVKARKVKEATEEQARKAAEREMYRKQSEEKRALKKAEEEARKEEATKSEDEKVEASAGEL